jgi:hypothetical protein
VAEGLAAISDDKMFAPVKQATPEKLDQARHRRQARQVIGVLTFRSCRIRGREVKRVGSGNTLASVYYSGCRHELPDGVMAVLAPHLEVFADVDGKESLRITECGIAATAKRGR